MTNILKKGWPYLLAVVVFAVLSFVFFRPVLEGKQLSQMDNIHAKAMSKELVDHQAKTGEKSMWTNSMFGGMPAYQIKGDASTNIFSKVNRFTRLGLPYQTVAIVFLYMLGFFLLLLSLRVDKWLSLVGAIAFAFGSYNLIIISAGHITQSYAVALMAPVLAGILYAYNRNQIIGSILTAVALGAEIAYNHIQITYYLGLLVLVVLITKAVQAYNEKQFPKFVKTSAFLGLAVVLAILPNLSNLWTTSEYGKLSTRGKSELKADAKQGSGLDKDYAFAWSYGKKETWTLMVPNVVGGASQSFEQETDILDQINDENVRKAVAGQSQYWGGRSFTSGPVYVGAVICFLFVLSLFVYKGKEKWWLIGGTVLALFLGWGKNFGLFNDLMFDFFPLYNKFRTVEMALVIATVTMPVMAFLGLKEIYEKPELISQNLKWFGLALGLTGGICLIFYAMSGVFFDFMSADELKMIAEQKAKMPQYASIFDQILVELPRARMALLKTDALRSFFFIVLASGSIWMYVTNKISSTILTVGIALLIIIDLWSIGKRYINDDMFQENNDEMVFVQSACDKAILADKSLYYRVFPVYRNPFTDGNTPYHHKSIGGYHGAKLRRYQDVIDHYLMSEWQNISGALQKGTVEGVMSALQNSPVSNMLNDKYIIYNPDANPIQNPYAMGNAWFVQNIEWVGNADEELTAIGKTNLRNHAVVMQEFKDKVQTIGNDSVTGTITLTSYSPNKLTFEANADKARLAVFSDIYYPAGWKAFVDGQETLIIRANYILRALMVPQGKHTIEFRFEPSSYKTGKTVALIGSILVLLLISGGIYYYRKNKDKMEA
jgi:hypothetical protein